MRRALVAKHHAPGTFGFAAGLAFEQEGDAAGKQGDLGILPGDDIAQLFDGAGQVGDLFFEFFHGAWLAPGRAQVLRGQLRPS